MQRAGLAQRDIDLFTSIVLALGEIRVLTDLREATVRLLPELVPTTLIAWNEVDVRAGSMMVEMAPDRSADASVQDFIANIGDHPVIENYERTRDGRPRAISDFLDEHAFHSTRIYQTFYRPLGAEDQISLTLPETRVLIGIALNRDRRGFSQRDRTLLNLLRPVLTQAYTNATASERLERVLASVGTAAERSGEGVLLLDAQGRPEFIGKRSRALLEQWFGTDGGGAVPAPLADWLAEAHHRPGPAWPFILERDGRRLVVRLLSADAGEVLLLSEPPPVEPIAVTAGLGLTPRETEVMALVGQAVPTGAIALRLGISQGTVYKHVQNALDKLGASSRIEAVNLLRQAEGPELR